MKKYVVLLLGLCIVGVFHCNGPLAREESTYPLAQELEFGKYSVGFQSVQETDFGRGTFSDADGHRPVSFGVWYPAKRTGQRRRMRYLDYMRYPDRTIADSIQDAYVRQHSFLGDLDTSMLLRNIRVVTHSLWRAPVIGESVPLVIYAGRANDLIYGNCFLFEYLASHGYAVLSLPPQPTKGDLESMPLNNVNDIYFAINYLKREMPNLDVSQIATMGYEVGGVSTAALAIGNPHVKAHISLQGAVGSWFGWQFAKNLYPNDLKDMSIPVLHIGTGTYEREPTYVMGESTFETSDSMYNARRYFYYLAPSVPLGVSSHLIMTWVQPLISIKKEYDINEASITAGYAQIVNLTHQFLDVYLLNKDAKGLETTIMSGHQRNFIKPAD